MRKASKTSLPGCWTLICPQCLRYNTHRHRTITDVLFRSIRIKLQHASRQDRGMNCGTEHPQAWMWHSTPRMWTSCSRLDFLLWVSFVQTALVL